MVTGNYIVLQASAKEGHEIADTIGDPLRIAPVRVAAERPHKSSWAI